MISFSIWTNEKQARKMGRWLDEQGLEIDRKESNEDSIKLIFEAPEALEALIRLQCAQFRIQPDCIIADRI